MKFDDNQKKYAEITGLIAFGVILAAVFINFSAVLSALKTLIGFFLPLIAGLMIAFILDVPARSLQSLIGRISPKSVNSRWIRKISVVLTLMILAGIITLIAVTINPVIVTSARSANTLIIDKIPALNELLRLDGKLAADADAYLENFLSNGIPEDLKANFSKVAYALAGKAADTVSFILAMAIGFIISVYVLFDKETVLEHTDRLITATFSPKTAFNIRKICRMINEAYSKFLSGQCIDALILGIFMFAVLVIFRIPYAALISVLAAVFSFIPYLGAFLAIAFGALLTFITAPDKLILFIILYMAIQIIEEQFIYPHVVGNSVGLTPLLTLLSVIIGGSTFGLMGILFFIPLMSVIYDLTEEWADRRIKNRAAETDPDE